jgi:hypothetical protein
MNPFLPQAKKKGGYPAPVPEADISLLQNAIIFPFFFLKNQKKIKWFIVARFSADSRKGGPA